MKTSISYPSVRFLVFIVIGAAAAMCLSSMTTVDAAWHQHNARVGGGSRARMASTSATKADKNCNSGKIISTWFRDVFDDFATTQEGQQRHYNGSDATRKGETNVLHECVVNYGWGLVGNF
jgi:hypothetical protein